MAESMKNFRETNNPHVKSKLFSYTFNDHARVIGLRFGNAISDRMWTKAPGIFMIDLWIPDQLTQ